MNDQDRRQMSESASQGDRRNASGMTSQRQGFPNDSSSGRQRGREGDRGYGIDPRPIRGRRREDGRYDREQDRDRDRDSRYRGRSWSRDGRGRPPSDRRGRDQRNSRGRGGRDDYYGPRDGNGPPNDRGGRDDYYDDDYQPPRRGRASSYDTDPRRRSRSSSPSRRRPSKKPIEWPPCFQDHGSAFEFDSRSGTFYESQSDFFYDPRSKLYYGNKKAIHYRYDENKTPPFVEVQKPGGGDLAPEATDIDLHPSIESSTGPSTKPMIAINLKTKKVKKSKGVKNDIRKDKAAQPKKQSGISKVVKEQAAHIDKWNEKQVELKGETAESSTRKNIHRTVKGEPICLLCRRKFQTLEKLLAHEQRSELHKQNVVKQEAPKAKKRTDPPSPTTEYTDRAQKRRNLHGPPTSLVAPPPKAPLLMQDSTPNEPMATAPESLGESHIGNQLLQRMGWSKETGLGKQRNDADSSQADSIAGGATSTADDLRKDWDRIEALAGNGGRPRR